MAKRYEPGMKAGKIRGESTGQKLGAAEMAVAERLKQLRTEKGLTLSQLASAAGCSAAFLSRLENHRISVPIASLERLALALGVSISVFFENTAETLPLVLCRRGTGARSLLRGSRGFPFESLAGRKMGKLMEPIIVEVTPKKPAPKPRPHAGEEFDYILEGECDLIYGRQRIRLRRGDAVYYDARVPHMAVAVKNTVCRILVVVASRDYLFHGDLTRLMSDAGGE
jgi:transcriptional regulator with XRE-family HTH domain